MKIYYESPEVKVLAIAPRRVISSSNEYYSNEPAESSDEDLDGE